MRILRIQRLRHQKDGQPYHQTAARPFYCIYASYLHHICIISAHQICSSDLLIAHTNQILTFLLRREQSSSPGFTNRSPENPATSPNLPISRQALQCLRPPNYHNPPPPEKQKTAHTAADASPEGGASRLCARGNKFCGWVGGKSEHSKRAPQKKAYSKPTAAPHGAAPPVYPISPATKALPADPKAADHAPAPTDRPSAHPYFRSLPI